MKFYKKNEDDTMTSGTYITLPDGTTLDVKKPPEKMPAGWVKAETDEEAKVLLKIPLTLIKFPDGSEIDVEKIKGVKEKIKEDTNYKDKLTAQVKP